MTGETNLRCTIIASASLMVLAAIQQLYRMLEGGIENGAIAVVLACGVVGLVRRVQWGRRIAVLFFWACLLVGLGLMSPFRAGDLMVGGMEPPTMWVLGAEFLVVAAVAITGLHHLGKHKALFRAQW